MPVKRQQYSLADALLCKWEWEQSIFWGFRWKQHLAPILLRHISSECNRSVSTVKWHGKIANKMNYILYSLASSNILILIWNLDVCFYFTCNINSFRSDNKTPSLCGFNQNKCVCISWCQPNLWIHIIIRCNDQQTKTNVKRIEINEWLNKNKEQHRLSIHDFGIRFQSPFNFDWFR